MSTLSWNCRGLGNSQTVQEVMALEAKNKPTFIFLMETKVRRQPAESLKLKLHFDGLFYVDGGGLSGGLALFWKDRASTEKRGIHNHPSHLMTSFNNVLDDCHLFDLGMKGRPFTWEKSKGTINWVEERLDRAVAGCGEIVNEAWENSVGETIPSRLDYCGEQLRRWGGDLGKRLTREIETTQKRINLLRGRTDHSSLAMVRELDNKMRQLYSQQNIFWRQRAKQYWLTQGDRNTKFFHCYATSRKKKNTVVRLKNEAGIWTEGTSLLLLAKDYFCNIFHTAGSMQSSYIDRLHPKISDEDNDRLLQPFTPDEVKEAIFSMAPDKSPGPDGFNPGFFQHFWGSIGSDITNFVLHCLHSRTLPEGMNDAYITLVPKKTLPMSMGDLRPTALCNVTYKILAKMVANRLKVVLEKTISDSQSAFIPGRLITDNVLIASEVIHYLNRKREGKTGWCALKLDMAKAYDKMEWDYLRAIMEKLGFHTRWIELIMLCVSTVRYKVNMNGSLIDYIIPTRGLRQGDPLSPYLFILCAEGLSHLLSQSVYDGRISPCIVARGAPGISHLFFADDSLLFFKSSVHEANVVRDCLKAYESMFGQTVNFTKSCIVFSKNVDSHNKIAVASTLGVTQADSIGKYLGLPLGIGRNRKEVFSFIEAKLKQRLGGWSKRILSRAGKEVLLKSVAQSLPTYTMSLYYLSITFCEHIERMMNKYWWLSKSSNGGGVRWLAWNRMTFAKSEGGLGFKNLNKFNIALLAKQDFLKAKLGSNPSYSWRSILAGVDVLRRGCFRRIGDGRATKIWHHPWLPDKDHPYVQTPISDELGEAVVGSLIDHTIGDWNSNMLTTLFLPRDVELIKSIPVSVDFADKWSWRGDIRGLYSVRNGYRMLREDTTTPPTPFTAWKALWKTKLPPKVLNFAWRCATNVLPSVVSLATRGVVVDPCCPICLAGPETMDHIFFECSEVKDIWLDTLDLSLQAQVSFELWLSSLFEQSDAAKICKSLAICWNVWKRRNEWVWNRRLWSMEMLKQSMDSCVLEWQSYSAASSPIISNHTTLSSSLNGDIGFYGVVVFDDGGRYVAAKSGPIRCLKDPHLAEAMAIKEALSWILLQGWRKVIIHSDCQMVCRFINHDLPDSSYAGNIINQCRVLKRHFEAVSIEFISRSANTCAHALARAANVHSGHVTWFSSIPPCIEQFIV
ncbi:PREDICTED: uncharacterized protein LOC109173576 [Ipomoea nil]|uniref:uncharacterized protein LOC109173576 n=1 Tax=Ipomoea nil TaxID=35883 RepID=UPI00090141EB|nr:PREDICTED: uncharacterized protein LOC109173576 [Ipomoea nil]